MNIVRDIGSIREQRLWNLQRRLVALDAAKPRFASSRVYNEDRATLVKTLEFLLYTIEAKNVFTIEELRVVRALTPPKQLRNT